MRTTPLTFSDLSCSGEEKVPVTVDSVAYSSKPQVEYGAISKRLVQAESKRLVTVSELMKLVCAGYTFCPGIFACNRRANDSWTCQQVFALDMDDGASVETFLSDADKWNVLPAFVYPTFSHRLNGKGDRFRTVFVCDQVVTDVRIREMVQRLLFMMFGQNRKGLDKHCKDAARMFLGTNHKPLFVNTSQKFNPIGLLQAYLEERCTNDPSHIGTICKETAAALGIAFRDGRFVVVRKTIGTNVSGENCVGAYKKDLLATDFSPDYQDCSIVLFKDIQNEVFYRNFIQWDSRDKGISSLKHHKNTRMPSESVAVTKTLKRISTEDWRTLLNRCRLLHEFMAGTRYLQYPERQRLLSNLCQLSGGYKRYQEGIDAWGAYGPDNLIRDSRRYTWLPADCSGCTYESECEHGKNLLQQIPVKRREFRNVEIEQPTVSLGEAQERLKNELVGACVAYDGKVHVIRACTGVGKTEALLSACKSNAVLAFPTHRLKEEAFERYIRSGGVGGFVSQKRPGLPEPYETELQLCLLQRSNGTAEIMQRALLDDAVQDQELANAIASYCDSLKAIHRSGFIFTTHEKALQLSNTNRFVFDEDPFNTLVRVVEVKEADLKQVLEYIKHSPEKSLKRVGAHIRSIISSPVGMVKQNDSANISSNAVRKLVLALQHKSESPIASIFAADAYVRDAPGMTSSESVYCIEKRSLRENATHIILSGTANHWMYKKLLGDRLVFTDTGRTALKGKLLLHPKRGFSKQYIQAVGAGEFVRQVRDDQERYGFSGVITHKFIVEPLRNGGVEVYAHFGALEGLDGFGGSNLAVYGTPHLPEYVLMLYAHILGIRVETSDFKFSERVMDRHGFQFSFPTCSDQPELQELQLSLIEAGLMQAVGRARLVRNDCEVHVFSNIALPGGTLA